MHVLCWHNGRDVLLILVYPTGSASWGGCRSTWPRSFWVKFTQTLFSSCPVPLALVWLRRLVHILGLVGSGLCCFFGAKKTCFGLQIFLWCTALPVTWQSLKICAAGGAEWEQGNYLLCQSLVNNGSCQHDRAPPLQQDWEGGVADWTCSGMILGLSFSSWVNWIWSDAKIDTCVAYYPCWTLAGAVQQQ